MAIQESWLKSHHKFFIPNYTVVRCDRRDDANGGGVLLLIKKGIPFRHIELSTNTIETVAVQVGDSIVASAYSAKFNNSFISDIRKLCNKNNIIVAADINAKHSSWSCSPENVAGKKLFDALPINNCLVHATTMPTHYTKNSSSTIDFIITNHSGIDEILCANDLHSDHVAIYTSVCLSFVNKRKQISCLNKADWPMYRNTIKDNIRNAEISLTSQQKIDDALSQLSSFVKNAYNAAVPTCEAKEYQFDISDRTKAIIGAKNKLVRDLQRCKSAHDYATLKSLVENARQLSRYSAKIDYENNWDRFIESTEKSSRQFWKVTKKIRARNSNTQITQEDGTQVHSNTQVAQMFCDQFATVYDTIWPVTTASSKITDDHHRFMNIVQENDIVFDADSLLNIAAALKKKSRLASTACRT